MRPAEKEEAEIRKNKFSESQIVAILKESGAGLPVAEVCRKHGTVRRPGTAGRVSTPEPVCRT